MDCSVQLHCCVRRMSSENILDDSDSHASSEYKAGTADQRYNIKRTVIVVRNSLEATFGFALQSYVFKRRNASFTEQLTYVDYVRDHSPAAKAGVKRGDVILSINGFSAVGQSHSSLVTFINSMLRMKLVLLFQNIARIVQLSARSIQLQYILKEKEVMVKLLDIKEKKLVSKGLEAPPEEQIPTDNGSLHPDDPSPSDRISFCSLQSEYDNSESITRL